MPISALRNLRADLARESDRGSNLKYIWIRGNCCTFPPIRDLIVASVAGDAKVLIPNSHAKPLWAFYSAEVEDAFNRFRAIARMILEVAIDGLGVWRERGAP